MEFILSKRRVQNEKGGIIVILPFLKGEFKEGFFGEVRRDYAPFYKSLPLILSPFRKGRL
jgi:hypothetical protein